MQYSLAAVISAAVTATAAVFKGVFRHLLMRPCMLLCCPAELPMQSTPVGTASVCLALVGYNLVALCRREVERRTHPLSKADFALLASELEAWRQQQTGAIKSAGLDPMEEQVGGSEIIILARGLSPTLEQCSSQVGAQTTSLCWPMLSACQCIRPDSDTWNHWECIMPLWQPTHS